MLVLLPRRNMAYELEPFGIRVVLVEPGVPEVLMKLQKPSHS